MDDDSWLSSESAPDIGPQVIFGLDAEGRCTLSVGSGLAALGLRPGELVGTNLLDFYRDDPLSTEALTRALAGEAFTGERDYEGRRLSLYFQPVHDPQGTLTGALGVATDVTEQRRVEQEVRTARRRAHHLEQLSTVLTREVLELPKLVDVAVRALGEAAGQVAVLWLRSPDGEQLTPAAAWHRAGSDHAGGGRLSAERLEAAGFHRPAPVAEALDGPRVTNLRAPDPMRDPDPLPDSDPLLDELAASIATGELLQLPLRSRGVLIGMVDIARAEDEGPLNDDDLRLVSDIAQRCALALDNAILLDAHQRARDELVKFQALADASDNLIGISDEADQLVYLNPPAARAAADATDRDVWETLSSLAGPELSRAIRTQFDATGRWSGELPALVSDPVFVTHLEVFQLRHPETAAELGTAWIAQDITELRLANIDLSRFKALVSASPDFIAIASLDGTVQYVNPGGRAMVGLPADLDVTTTTIEDYLTPEGLAASRAVEQPAVIARGHWEGESTLRDHRGDAAIPVAIASFLMHDITTGEPFALATVQRDITEREAAERSLRELAKQREALLTRLVDAQEAERIQIAADVHDDTVQVCAAVDLRLGLLRRQLTDAAPDVLDGLEAAQASVSAATDRLRALLFDLEPPDLTHGLTPALARAARELLEATTIQPRIDGRREPAVSEATRAIAYRIAKEALVNVVKHSQAQHVTVSLTGEDGGLAVEVGDDGIGPGPETTRSMPGHRGIAGMLDRATLAGGWCKVQERTGGGTCVSFWLPGTAAG